MLDIIIKRVAYGTNYVVEETFFSCQPLATSTLGQCSGSSLAVQVQELSDGTRLGQVDRSTGHGQVVEILSDLEIKLL